MPVSFTVSDHGANPVKDPYKVNADAEELLARTWGQKAKTMRCKELLQTSLVKPNFSTIHEQGNGFVHTVLAAYNQHHHLILRPDDVWIAILAQFNFYVNAHSEELRHQFVAHDGQKELKVCADGSRYTVNFGSLAYQMTNEIDKNVIDKDLKDWILPSFTTTTNNDTVVCSVIMMATLKAYFTYTMKLACGIPSVTLEGEKGDWEKLLKRVDKLGDFGSEPAGWASLLRPILTRFVAAFDGQPDIEFWKKVCHIHNNFSGPSYLSGWLTAFCVWTSTGKWQGPSLNAPFQSLSAFGTKTIKNLILDDIHYGIIKSRDIPTGICEVPVKLDDNGLVFDCTMVSGHLAYLVEGEAKDTVRPLPLWFMFVHEACEDPEVVEMRRLMEEFDR